MNRLKKALTTFFSSKKSLWLTLLIACSATPLTLADVGNPMRFGHLGMDEGLSQSTVNVMHQDSTGFLWLGTENGLNRYDGIRVHHYKREPDNPDSLGADFVWDIAEDDAGDLWIATNGGGVARWNSYNDQFTNYRHSDDDNSISSDVIRAVAHTKDGSIWLGTQGDGLDRLNPETGEVENFQHDPSNENSIAGNKVFSLLHDSRGILWISTDSGMSRLDPITRVFTNFRHDPNNAQSLSSNEVRAIYEDGQGILWIGTRSAGLNRFERESGTFTHFTHDSKDPGSISQNSIRAIYEDDAGRLWIGTGKGLNLFQRQRQTFASGLAPVLKALTNGTLAAGDLGIFRLIA